jgi:hypothetical protein
MVDTVQSTINNQQQQIREMLQNSLGSSQGVCFYFFIF